MIRIYADWNSMDAQGRLRLSIAGAVQDLEQHKDALRDGMSVVINVQNEFEVSATLVFDGEWLALPDEGTIRFYAGGTGPG